MGTRPPVPERANFAPRKSSLLSCRRIPGHAISFCPLQIHNILTRHDEREEREREGEFWDEILFFFLFLF